MPEQMLAGLKVLVVEDEYYLADDAVSALQEVGADVLAPVGTVAQACAKIDAEEAVDVVLLDVNLQGEKAYEVADLLRSRDLPFAFVTGYDPAALPDRFADAVTAQKPVSPEQLSEIVAGLARRERTPARAA